MHLLLSIVAIGFAFDVVLGALSFVRELRRSRTLSL
jgi:hypothetical protein